MALFLVFIYELTRIEMYCLLVCGRFQLNSIHSIPCINYFKRLHLFTYIHTLKHHIRNNIKIVKRQQDIGRQANKIMYPISH